MRIFFLLSIIVFCSCDPSTTERKIIINNTDSSLIIFINDSSVTPPYKHISDSIFIPQKSEKTIYDKTLLGRVKHYNNKCYEYADSMWIKVYNNESLNCVKDPNDNSNWMFYEIDKYTFGGGEIECKLIIENEDLE